MAKSVIPLSELPVFDSSSGSDFKPSQFQTGAVVLIDKPLDWSSFQAVKFVRFRVPAKKVGHAGTLDPLATGLLVMCTGKATKTISQIQDLPKEYIANIRFGASTPSFDAALPPDETSGWDHINTEMARKKLENEFTGEIMQKPPVYSAIKMKGERLYKKARRGEDVKIAARPVRIMETEIVESEMPDMTIRVKCGKGTYIRSLAHDLGIALGSRAYLTGLRRTKIGHFDVKDAVTTDQFADFIKKNSRKSDTNRD